MKKIRVLLSKAGLDGHNRGVIVLAQLLREAGMEVIYLGEQQLPENIVSTAIQEDVDVIGISMLSGSHVVFMPDIIDLLKKEAVKDNFLLLLGGIIPNEDIPDLKNIGVDGIFSTGSKVEDIISYIRTNVKER